MLDTISTPAGKNIVSHFCKFRFVDSSEHNPWLIIETVFYAERTNNDYPFFHELWYAWGHKKAGLMGVSQALREQRLNNPGDSFHVPVCKGLCLHWEVPSVLCVVFNFC
jgi:hypothetical protein